MKLNKLETALLKVIVEENKQKYPFLEEQLANLIVLNRTFTGVGMYVNFLYTNLNDKEESNIISSSKTLLFPQFEYELTYVLFITNSKMHFLEIVTNEDTLFDNTTNLDDFRLE
ncbi:MAG: hypothetical protein LBG67_03975 [Campylobacteraceae bacterium]|jgi:hypothetical protein|nr:hypothetical protein [Campylobacteraceae bacterium]